MKLTVPRDHLLAACKLANLAVASSPTMPAFGSLQLYAHAGDTLEIIGADLDKGLKVTIHATVEEEGGILLPARLLVDYLDQLPEGVRIDVQVQNLTLTANLKAGRQEANIKGFHQDDAPAVAFFDTPGDKDLVLAIMPEAITAARDVTFAASQDENRPTLTCVRCVIDQGRLDFQATDGYRLSWKTLTNAADAERQELLIPHANLETLARIVAEIDADDDMQMILAHTGAMFTVLAQAGGRQTDLYGIIGIHFASALMDARYPDVAGVIPRERPITATVDVDHLAKAAKGANVFARDNATLIAQLDIVGAGEFEERGTLRLSAAASDLGDNRVEVDADTAGVTVDQPFTMHLNIRYLLAVLANTTGARRVRLEAQNNKRPLVLFPLDKDGNQTSMQLIMPMTPGGASA